MDCGQVHNVLHTFNGGIATVMSDNRKSVEESKFEQDADYFLQQH